MVVRYPDWLSSGILNAHVRAFSVVYVLWLVSFFVFHFFEQQTFSRLSLLLRSLVLSMTANAIIAIVYFYAQPNLILTPRRFLLIHVVATFVLLLVWALVLRLILRKSFVTPVYIVSLNNELEDLRHVIDRNQYLGFTFIDFLTDATLAVTQLHVDSVVIVPDQIHSRPDVWHSLYALRSRGVRLLDHKQFHEELLRSIYLPTLNELWFLQNIHYSEKRLYKLLKRIIDIVCGVIGVSVLVVTFPIIALLVRLSSAGPIFFAQQRVGKDGDIFTLYKYRTMRLSGGDTWTAANDPRIAGSIGRFLRRTRLDELAQALMILRGDMSLVGPRPEQVHIVEQLRNQIPFYDERHVVKPGLTGWAQLHVYAGTLEETQRKLQYDLYYVKHRSLLLDAEIILKTINTVLTGSGT